MEIRHEPNIVRQPDTVRNAILVGGMIAASGLLGIALTAGASDHSAQILFVAATGLGLILGVSVLAFDLSLISLVRAAFVASFFIKIDMNLFKIDEMEDPSGLNLSATLLLAIILLAYDKLNNHDEGSVFPSILWLILTALFCTAAASVVLAGAQTLGLFSLFSLAASILVAYTTASHFGRHDRIKTLILWLAIGICFTGLVGLSQFILEWPLAMPFFGTGTEEELLGTQSQSLGRVQAFLRTPTEMAWVISTLVPLVIAPFVFRVKTLSSSHKNFLTVAGLLGCVAIVLSLARGSWIGIVTSVLLLVVFAWFRLPRAEKKSFLLSGVGVAVLLIAVMVPFSERIYDRLTGDDQGAAAIRLPLMQNALLMIEDNAVAGVGLNGYRSTMTKYDETGVFVSTIFPNPVHNVFAHITAEVGIVGGVLFSLLLIYGIAKGISNSRSPDRLIAALSVGVAIGLVAFVISAVKEPGSLGSGRPPIRTCFLLIGAVMAVSRIRNYQDLVRRDRS